MYLLIVMDLYSRRVVGWHIDKRMTADLVSKAMMKACYLRQSSKDLVFHSEAHDIAVVNIENRLKIMALEPEWAMLALVGITMLLRGCLVA